MAAGNRAWVNGCHGNRDDHCTDKRISKDVEPMLVYCWVSVADGVDWII